MFALSIAFCSESVRCVIAKLRGSVRALMVSPEVCNFQTISLWLIYTMKKRCVSSETAMQECERGQVTNRATEGR